MRRRTFLTLLSATATTAVASCSTGPTGGSEESASSGGAAATSGDYPVSIKDAFGTTTIKSAPSRIATFGWGDQDVLVALGVVPIGSPKVRWANNAKGSTDEFDAKLAELDGKQPTRYSDADGAPIDEIAKLRPDLVLATNSGVTGTEHKKLAKLAPTVGYPTVAYGTSWQESLKLVGQAVGKKAEATKLTTRLEKKISDEVKKHPAIKGKSVAWLFFNPTDFSKFAIYTVIDNRPRMGVELGLKNAPMVEKLSKGSKQFYVEVSAEKASTLDADIVAFHLDKPSQIERVRKHPLLGRIPAIKRGSFVATTKPEDTVFLSGPTPLNIPDGLPRFLPQLDAAAKKA